MDTEQILERLYGQSVRRRSFLENLRRSARRLRFRFTDSVLKHELRLILISVGVASWIVAHVYYYNQLVLLESDVETAAAQIEASMEKREHIQRTLTRLLRYYASYERSLMKDVTQMRVRPQALGQPEDRPRAGAAGTTTPELPPKTAANAGEAAPKAGASDPAAIGELLGRFNAVAEQYPNLHLSQTAGQLSDAFVMAENEVTKRIHTYNTAINIYTNMMQTFPASLFAKTLGFKDLPYYKPADPKSLTYREPDL